MNTIHIGNRDISSAGDVRVNYDYAVSRIVAGTKPQFIIELSLRSFVAAQIYSASKEAHEKVRKLIAQNITEVRVVPELDVLGVFIHRVSKGYPEQSRGAVISRKTAKFVIAQAQGTLPEKVNRLFPVPQDSCIEVIHGDLPRLIQTISYKGLDYVAIQNDTVLATFATKDTSGVLVLGLVTANTKLPGLIARAINEKKYRRFMVNTSVLGICLIYKNNRVVNLGNCSAAAPILVKKQLEHNKPKS